MSNLADLDHHFTPRSGKNSPLDRVFTRYLWRWTTIPLGSITKNALTDIRAIIRSAFPLYEGTPLIPKGASINPGCLSFCRSHSSLQSVLHGAFAAVRSFTPAAGRPLGTEITGSRCSVVPTPLRHLDSMKSGRNLPGDQLKNIPLGRQR